MRDYGTIPTQFWIDPVLQPLSSETKLLAVYLLTGPHTNMLGCFRLPLGYIAEDLQWGLETVSKGLQQLVKVGFLTHDASGWLLLHDFLKWNPIENPNQGKSIIKLFEQIPPNTRVFKPLVEHLRQHDHYFPEPFKNRLTTLWEPLSNQDQEQDQDQKQDQEQDQNQKQEESAAQTDAASLPAAVLPTAVVSILLNDRSEYPITQLQIDEWQALFPAIDVLQTLRHIRSWNKANPKRRKTKSGILNHITQWLAKEQNENNPSLLKKSAHANSTLFEYNQAVCEQWVQAGEETIVNAKVSS